MLNIVNKIVAAEMLPTKQPIFLTTMDLEQSYKMVSLQALPESKSAVNH